jgi:hypothetical protein
MARISLSTNPRHRTTTRISLSRNPRRHRKAKAQKATRGQMRPTRSPEERDPWHRAQCQPPNSENALRTPTPLPKVKKTSPSQTESPFEPSSLKAGPVDTIERLPLDTNDIATADSRRHFHTGAKHCPPEHRNQKLPLDLRVFWRRAEDPSSLLRGNSLSDTAAAWALPQEGHRTAMAGRRRGVPCAVDKARPKHQNPTHPLTAHC